MQAITTFFKELGVKQLFGVMLIVGISFAFWLLGNAEKASVRTQLEDAKTEQKEQQILRPLMKIYNDNIEKAEKILAQKTINKSTQTSLKLDGILTTLREIAADSGMETPHFIPKSESLIGVDYLQIDGTMMGETESLRKFTENISLLPWITQANSLEIATGAAGPNYRIALFVKKTELDEN